MVGDIDALGDIAGHRRDRLRQTKVQNLDRAIRPDLDIRGLQIPMDDALLVRSLECLGNLQCDGDDFVEGQRASRDPIGERLSFDQFQHESSDRRV